MSRGLNYHACCKPEMEKKNKSVGLLCVPTANVASLLKFLFKEDFFSTPKCFVFGGGVELLYLLIVLKLSKLEQKR